MLDAWKTKAQLIEELTTLRQKLAALEQTNHTNEQRYRALVEDSLGLMCVHDLDGILLLINPAAAQALGYHPRDGIGKSLREFLAPAVRHGFDEYLDRIRQQPTDSGLMRLVTRQGEERIWFYRNVRYNEPGRAPYVIGHAQDITELVQAKDALTQAHATLEQQVAELAAANMALHREMAERQRMQEALFQQEKLAALGTLLANVAHELNNPLAVAAMQVDNLREEEGSDSWSEDLETLRQAVERCQSVVQGFLALARQQPPTRRAVDFNAVMGDVLVLLRHPMAVDDITIERHLAEDLPPLWADANQLHHVIANLLTNAHHALRQTPLPRHLRLTTTATADRSQVTLEVADSGPGIPEELQRRVFDPFFTTKPQGVGSGLGLPLCRNIVESHGGTIRLDSQPGQGTTVAVTLPAAAPEVQFPEVPPEPVALAQRQRGTILLIDDEPGVQKALKRLLQRSGHDITTAANGQEGLAALAERSYAVILCDMRMPDLDGPGFYRELEQRYPHLLSRLIFLTGDVLNPEAEAFFAQVNRPRLLKPFKAQEVRRMIQQVLEAR